MRMVLTYIVWGAKVSMVGSRLIEGLGLKVFIIGTAIIISGVAAITK